MSRAREVRNAKQRQRDAVREQEVRDLKNEVFELKTQLANVTAERDSLRMAQLGQRTIPAAGTRETASLIIEIVQLASTRGR